MSAAFSALLAFCALTYALRASCRSDRRRPAPAMRRPVIFIWWAALAGIGVASFIERYQVRPDMAQESWHFVIVMSLIGLSIGIRVVTGRLW